MRYTKEILGRKKPAMEAEEPVVDQTVIDALPAGDELPTETPTEEPVTDAPVEDTPAEEPVSELPVDAPVDAPLDTPAEAPIDQLPLEGGAGEITPPDAEAPEIAPTTDTGEVVVDQVQALADGDQAAAVDAVAEADTLAGNPTTPEEVVEQTEEVQSELNDGVAVDAPVEPTLPGDEPATDLPLDTPVDAPLETPVDEPVLDAPTEEPTETPTEEPAPAEEPVAEVPADASAAAASMETDEPGMSEPAPSDSVVEDTGDGSVSNEGFLGGLVGFLIGGTGWTPFVGAAVNGAVKAKRMEMRKDIEVIAKRIEKVRKGDIADAQKNGLEIPKRDMNIDWIEVLKSALLGQFFGPFYGARQGSEIENLNKELRAKLAELEKEIEKSGISVESMSLEGCACEDVEVPAVADVVEAPIDGVVDAPVDAPVEEPVAVTDVVEPAAAEEPLAAEVSDTVTDGELGNQDVVGGEELEFNPLIMSDEDQAEGEVLEEALDTYPQVVSVLEEALDNGGISNEAMQLLNIFTKRDGIPVDSNVSLESYNHTARSQTRVALESIKEDIVNWIKQLIQSFGARFDSFVTYLGKLFDLNERMKKRLAEIKTTISTGVNLTSTQVGGFSDFKFILKDNSVDQYRRNLDAVVNLSNQIYSVMITDGGALAMNSVATFRTKLLANITKRDEASSDDFIVNTQKEIEESLDSFIESKVRRLFPNVDNGYFSDTLLGDVALGVDVHLAGDTDRVTKLKMEIKDKRPDQALPETVASLSPSDASAVVASVEKLLSVIDDTKSAVEKTKALVNDLRSEMNRLLALSSGQGDTMDRLRSGNISHAIMLILGIVTGIATAPALETNKYLLRVSNGALNYVEASIKGKETPAE